MRQARMTVSTSVYASSYSQGHVHAEISCRLHFCQEDGEEFSSYDDDPVNVARANLSLCVSQERHGRPHSSVDFSLYRPTSARLTAAAKVLKPIEERLEHFLEEDGDPASLAEAIRRAARAMGVSQLRIEGSDRDRSVCAKVVPEPIHLREITALCGDWFRRLDRFAEEIRAEEEARREAESSREEQAA